MDKSIATLIRQHFEIDQQEQTANEDMAQALAAKINWLILNDFTLLVQMLYRMDVSEQKLKLLLQEKPDEPAGPLIAQMIVDRLEKAKKSRQEFSREEDIAEEDRW